MAVVLVGHRRYGRVHAHAGEYADTEFFHVSYVPIFPMWSYWVSNGAGDADHLGFPIKLNGRSVVAAYLRVWLPAIAAFTFLVPSLVATSVAAAIAALCAWSWTWRSRRGARALQRSDFDRVALGSRCDPAWMTDDMREHLSRKLTASMAGRTEPRPPDDVARFGAKDLDEAILAYGLLRIAGLHHGDARGAADRLLVSAFDPPPSQGPYRESAGVGAPGLGAQISAAAQVHGLAAEARMRASAPHWLHDRWFHLFGVACLTGIAGYLIGTRLSATTVDARALASVNAPVGGRVVVRCDRVEDLGWGVTRGGDVELRVTLCWLGTHFLPVAFRDNDPPVEGPTFEGKLDDLASRDPHHRPWIAQLHRNVELYARSFDVFLEAEGEITGRSILLVATVSSLGALVGWPLWIRAFRRRRRGA